MSFLSRPRRAFLILFLFALVVYGNTFVNSWTYDDYPVVVDNPDSKSLAGFLADTRPGRPMRELTYIPDYMLFGANPMGYHVQQVLWHTANGYLLFLIFTTLGLSPAAALAGALLFLVHPLQSESLANISHRKELLALFFSQLTLLFYIRAVQARSLYMRLFFLLLVLAGYATALLSNETAVTLPILLIAYDCIFLKKNNRLIARHLLALTVVTLVASAWAIQRYWGLFSSEQLLSVYSKNSFIASHSYLPLWMGDLKVFVLYLAKIIVPFKLAPEYHISFSEELFQPLAWLGAGLLIAVIFVCYVMRNRHPIVTFGMVWFLALYLPISNVLPISYMMADRYMYLCLPGIALLFAYVYHDNLSRRRHLFFALLLLGFAIMTVIQNSYWKNEHTLWRHAVTVNPDSTWVQESAALSYLMSDDFERARYHAQMALTLNRYNTHAYLTLAKAQDRLGNLVDALKNYELFVNYGFMEYPDEVALVRNYLPLMRKRVFIVSQQ
jgi:hypothetical protein